MSENVESRGAAGSDSGAGAAALGHQHHHHHHHHHHQQQYEGSIEDIDRQLEALDQESDSDSESLEELDACENIEVVNRAGGEAADGGQAGPGLDVTVRYTICLFCKKPFQLKKELKKHLFEHMKNLKPMKEKKIVEKKFKCHKCFKTYTEKARAEKHMTKCKKVSKLLLDMSNTTPDGNRILGGGGDYEGGGGDKKKGGKFREPTSPRSLVFDPESDQDERWEHRERNTVVHFDERNIARGGSTDESPTSPPAVSGSGGGGGGGGGSYYQQYQRYGTPKDE